MDFDICAINAGGGPSGGNMWLAGIALILTVAAPTLWFLSRRGRNKAGVVLGLVLACGVLSGLSVSAAPTATADTGCVTTTPSYTPAPLTDDVVTPSYTVAPLTGDIVTPSSTVAPLTDDNITPAPSSAASRPSVDETTTVTSATSEPQSTSSQSTVPETETTSTETASTDQTSTGTTTSAATTSGTTDTTPAETGPGDTESTETSTVPVDRIASTGGQAD